MNENVSSFFELIVMSVDVEFGGITVPSGLAVDLGAF